MLHLVSIKPKPKCYFNCQKQFCHGFQLLSTFYSALLKAYCHILPAMTILTKRVAECFKKDSKSWSKPTYWSWQWICVGWAYLWLQSAAHLVRKKSNRSVKKIMEVEGEQCCTWWTYNPNKSVPSTVIKLFGHGFLWLSTFCSTLL